MAVVAHGGVLLPEIGDADSLFGKRNSRYVRDACDAALFSLADRRDIARCVVPSARLPSPDYFAA
jgi:hypothetical protein